MFQNHRARAFSVHEKQCGELITQSFFNVSKSLEQKSGPQTSSGSWQGWQSWGASSSSWDEQTWENANSENAENEQRDLVGIKRSKSILEVRVHVLTKPIFQESTWNKDKGTTTGLTIKKESTTAHSEETKLQMNSRSMMRNLVIEQFTLKAELAHADVTTMSQSNAVRRPTQGLKASVAPRHQAGKRCASFPMSLWRNWKK